MGTLYTTLFRVKHERSIIEIRKQFCYLLSVLNSKKLQDNLKKTVKKAILKDCFVSGNSYL